MAQDRPRKFKVGDLTGKDELLKRIPYGKKSGSQKKEDKSAVSPKEKGAPSPSENTLGGKEEEKVISQEPAGVFESDVSKKEEVEKLEAHWKSRMASKKEEESVKSEGIKDADLRDDSPSSRSNIKSYVFAVLLLILLGVIGASAGYFYSNPNKLKDIIGELFPSKVEENGLISPVPVPTSDKGLAESSTAKIGYVTENGSIFLEGKLIYEAENKWYGPQGRIYALPSGKRLAYLVLDEATAQRFSELDNVSEGPAIGYLNILNLSNGVAKRFGDEKVFINSGIAVSPDGNKIAYVSEPYGLRQVDLDSSEIEDLDESIDLKVVGGSLKYSSDGRYLYYSLAVSSGEGEVYSLEIWRINLETKGREPIIEVGGTFDPKVYGSPVGVEFDVKDNLLTFIKDGDLIVYDLDKDSEKFETVGSRGFTNAVFIDSRVAAIDTYIDGFSASVFNVNTGKEKRLQSLQIAKIEDLLDIDKTNILSRAVFNVVPVNEESLILEVAVSLKGGKGRQHYIIGSDINLESFNLFGEGSYPFIIK